MRNVLVELARLRYRRAAVLLVVLGLAGALAILGFALKDAVAPSASARAAAQAQADQQAADPAFQQQLQDCRRSQQNQAPAGQGGDEAGPDGSAPSANAEPAPGSAEQYPPGFDCDDMNPKAEWFLNWRPPDFVRDFGNQLQAVTMVLALFLALIGITFIGADWSAGTVGTQLLYQPRRGVVFGSKAGALALVGLVVGAVGAALTWVVTYWSAAKWGTTELIDQVQAYANGAYTTTAVPVSYLDLVGWAARASVLVAAAALGGYLMAMFFRSSLVATAILAGYGLIGEAVLRGLFRGIEPYLLSSRMLAWLHGPYLILRYPNMCMGNCEPTVTSISVTAGGLFLAVLLVAGLVVAGVTFARRDVN